MHNKFAQHNRKDLMSPTIELLILVAQYTAALGLVTAFASQVLR